MASERIPALAGRFAEDASHVFALTIERFYGQPDGDFWAIVDQTSQASRSSLNPSIILSILGRHDEWGREAVAAASELAEQAVCCAIVAKSVWDRRRTKRTRQRLISRLMDDYIQGWSRERGMDPAEVARLRREGGVA
jgi:hypothetical protein